MGHFVTGTNIGDAWLAAFDAITSNGGRLVNLAVDITEPCREDLGVRHAIEGVLAEYVASSSVKTAPQSIHTVANTIFPISLYNPSVDDAAERFMANAARGERGRAHAKGRRWGTYLGRLVSYPSRDGEPTNQLERMLSRLRGGTHWSDIYEMPIVAPGDDDQPCWETGTCIDAGTASAILHGDVRADALRRGGPCLAHVSVTLENGAVSMIALYRRHSYITRAYGNFLGLARLLSFLATESGNRVGSLMVVTGHATPDGTGAKRLLGLAQAAAGEVAPIEIGNRPLGTSWADLELPVVGS